MYRCNSLCNHPYSMIIIDTSFCRRSVSVRCVGTSAEISPVDGTGRETFLEARRKSRTERTERVDTFLHEAGSAASCAVAMERLWTANINGSHLFNAQGINRQHRITRKWLMSVVLNFAFVASISIISRSRSIVFCLKATQRSRIVLHVILAEYMLTSRPVRCRGAVLSDCPSISSVAKIHA